MLLRMKIERGSGASPANGVKRAGSAAAPGFAVAAEPTEAPVHSAAATSVSGVTPLDAILALQGGEGPVQRRTRQARRGKAALDALEELEHGIVLGRAAGGLQRRMEALRREAEMTGETGLDDVLREIDTRLAVELAKLERQLTPA
jgi:Class II flagellar assembly regulator